MSGIRKYRSSVVYHKILRLAEKYKYLVAVMFVTGVYAGILSGRTMPFAEGWYTYYAQCINHGEVVYRDFDYLFPPLYIYLIAFITKIFGYKIIMLRMMGVLFFSVLSGIVFLIMRELFKEPYACIAAMTAAFFLQTENAQVFYDYVRLMDIFACLTVLLLVRAVKTINGRYYYLYLFCAGISNALFCLIKQNMGLVFATYALVLVYAVNVVYRRPFRGRVKSIALYLDGLAVPLLFSCVLLLFDGSFLYYIKMTGAEAIAAKGGIMPILFGWLKNNVSSFNGGKSFAITILLIALAVYVFRILTCPAGSNSGKGGVVNVLMAYAP